MQLPNDRMREGDWPVSTLDITSGAVHAMSECYRQRTVVQGRTYTVNLLFDYRDDAVDIRSQLPRTGRVEFAAKSPIDRIRIRIPTWVDRSTMQVARTVGAATAGQAAGSYVDIDGLQAGETGARHVSASGEDRAGNRRRRGIHDDLGR